MAKSTCSGTFTQSEQLFVEKISELTVLLLALMKSQWWNRVWTLQELILPVGNVRLMAETGTHVDTITVDDLCSSFLNQLHNAYFICRSMCTLVAMSTMD